VTLPAPYYQDDAVTLYLGDSRAIVPLVSGVAGVITDPPYGVQLEAKQHKWFRVQGEGYEPNFEDNRDYIETVVVPVVRLCIERFGRVALTPGTRSAFCYPSPDEIGAVYNSSGTGSGKWGFVCSTPVLFYGKDPYLVAGLGRRPNSWQQPANDYADKNGHPCPKPYGLAAWLVGRASLAGETILDPFAGTKDLHRKAIGVEIEERYCEIIAERMSQSVLDLGA
jgi:DNA modification methylase